MNNVLMTKSVPFPLHYEAKKEKMNAFRAATQYLSKCALDGKLYFVIFSQFNSCAFHEYLDKSPQIPYNKFHHSI